MTYPALFVSFINNAF